MKCQYCEHQAEPVPLAQPCQRCNGVLPYVHSDAFRAIVDRSYRQNNYIDTKYIKVGVSIDTDQHLKALVRAVVTEVTMTITGGTKETDVRCISAIVTCVDHGCGGTGDTDQARCPVEDQGNVESRITVRWWYVYAVSMTTVQGVTISTMCHCHRVPGTTAMTTEMFVITSSIP